MRRRKPTSTTQINVRLDTELVHQLETRAKADGTTFSGLIRTLLIDGLDFTEPSLADVKPEPSLAEFRAYWLRRVRDTIEGEARKTPEAANKIEDDWRFLQRFDAKFTVFYSDVETELDPYVKIPKIRELLTGAPALPSDTKVKG
jgi:hypothetical protein